MGDAKDILGLPKVASLGGSIEKRKTPKDAFKKPDGVSREVCDKVACLLCFVMLYFFNLFCLFLFVLTFQGGLCNESLYEHVSRSMRSLVDCLLLCQLWTR